jgi:hypothetical protein
MPDLDMAWVGKAVDALVETWNSAPLQQRWTLGMVVVVCLALGRWLFPGLASVIQAFRGKGKG